ncbi:MAG: hypothetical protein ACTHJ2_04375 [Candidatus Nitrosocosmicus sp.]
MEISSTASEALAMQEEYGISILFLSLLKMAITVLIPGCMHAIEIIFYFYKERKD